ncbi:homologous recombination OB-fold protein isoform X2 [Ricinus communis]|uniref:homologous recombination OB-fold protein isoform X2 n=1 Tax=Ricinus communis TaxID=3988 RepID=UPI00201A5974|nr:homologous recombination OB-fold protein isoform X2 [Ricinus communis]
MGQPWEESLDLDDSDLPSLRPLKRQTTTLSPSQPFLQRCCSLSQNNHNLPSQLHPFIPGPAGTLQIAMLRRRNIKNEENTHEHEHAVPTQEYLRRAIQDSVEDDDDFTRHPWRSAVQFIRLKDGDGAIGIPLSAIKNWNNLDKLPQVVAIIKCCNTLNGLGDMMVTLKDPTGTIDATIHHRVLAETEFGKDVSVGAVLVIQKIALYQSACNCFERSTIFQVAVFSPSRAAHYLNITHSNIIKVIPKDTRDPQNRDCSAPTVKHVAPISERNEDSWMPQKPFSSSQGRTEGIMSSLRQDATRGSSHDEHMERDKATKHSCNSSREITNQNAIAGKELLLAHQNVANQSNETTDETDKNNNNEVVSCEQINPSTQAGRGNILENAPSASAAADSFNPFSNRGSGEVSGTKQRQPLTSSVALPQWTDEQLDELFALD